MWITNFHHFCKRPGKSEVDNASWDCFRGRKQKVRPLKQSRDALSTSLLPGLLPNSEVANRQHNSPATFQEYVDNTLDKLNATGSSKSIYIMGDFNINLLKIQTCHFAQNFLNNLQSYAFIPTIDKPTRVHNNSATLIDNIFLNKIDDKVSSGNIISDISDHFSQFCIVRSAKQKTSSQQNQFRDYSHFSERNFINELSEIDWDFYFQQ